MTRIRFFLVAFGVLMTSGALAVVARASSNTYYFSNSTGLDSNACTQTAPCKTLAKVQSLTLNPGDNVALLRGDSWTGGLALNQSGSSAGRIRFLGYGSATTRPRITGGHNGYCIRVNGSYATIDSLESDSCGYAGIGVFGSHVTIQGSAASGNAAGIRVGSDTSDVLITHNMLTNNNILNQNTSASSSGAFGILLNGTATVTFNTISGSYAPSLAYGWDGSGVELYNASNASIHHNTMIDNQAGLELGGSGSGNSIDYNKITANIAATDPKPTGIVLPGSVTGTRVSHNSVDLLGTNSQAIVCYSSCASNTSIKDNAVKAVLKALYVDNSGWSITGNVFNGPVQGVTLDSTNSKAPIGWVNPPRDLHETASSPTVDHGTVTVFSTDLDGNPVPDRPSTQSDAGAYEYQAAATP